jgi:phosphoribosyl 1,2-cyclic phosphodiesterase
VAALHGEAVRLTVLGSGSRGNAILVESGDAALLVDAGFSLKDLARRITQSGADPARVRALALTHEHGDHTRGAARAAATWSVPVAASAGTLAAVLPRLGGAATVSLPPARPVTVGGFRLTAYPTAHDAREPIMLVIEDAEGRRCGVAYDVGSPTSALQHACRGLDALVIESNHDEVMLRSSSYPPAVRARIAGRAGHLSNVQAATIVAAAAHAGLGAVVLVHLSETCNRADLALETMKAALRGTAFTGTIVVSRQESPTVAIDVGNASLQLALPLGSGGGGR